MEKKDEELMVELQAGSTSALEELFHRYKKPLLNYAIRILNNRADAEDVVGEVFLVLSSSASKNYVKSAHAKFSTWLYTIAHNAAVTKVRKTKSTISLWFKRPGADEEGELVLPDLENRPDAKLEEKEITWLIKHAIKKLPADQKEALILREYQNLTYEQISQVLNISLENVKITIFRAREQLRKDLTSVIKEEGL